MSGLSRTPGKRVWVNPHRGFESRPFRHNTREINELYDFSGFTHHKAHQKSHALFSLHGFFVFHCFFCSITFALVWITDLLTPHPQRNFA